MARVGNKTWYILKNVVIASAYVGVSSTTAYISGESVKILLYLLGAFFVLCAVTSFKDMGLRVLPAFFLGLGLLALSDYLVTNFDAMKTASRYLSAGLLIVVAFFQYGKKNDSYGSGTKLAFIMRLLPFLYPTLLIVGIAFTVFPSILPDGLAAEISMIFLAVGALGWIAYTMLVVKTLKETAPMSTENSSKSSGGKSSSSGGGKTVADVSTVRRAMESVANRLTGGYETLGSGTNIYFSTTVTVYEGEINFKVNGQVRGTANIKTQSDLDHVTSRIESVVVARQKRVMQLARQKMDELITDSDYTINVNVGELTQD